jgi:hypothetical protein
LPPPLPSPAVSASLPAAAPARAEATGPTDAPLLLPGGVDPLVPDTLAAMPPAPPFALPDAAARTGEPAYPGAEAPGVAGGAPAAPAMTPQMLVQYFQLPMTNRGTSGVAQASVVVPVFMPPPPPGGAGPGSSATYISH